jgi:lipoate-protein ligase A
MAADTALLDLAAREGVVVLRLYRWSPFCLSFGAHEPAARRYDRRRIGELGLDTVRRPTGGRAVWHARELTYAVAGPATAFGALRTAYVTLHRILADALRSLGAAPTLAAAPAVAAPVDAGACFARPAGGEVLVAGRKVVGSAQVRLGEAFLQHGSMLLEDDQALVATLGQAPAPPGGEAPLSSLVGRTVTWDEAGDAVARAFAAWTGGPAVPLEGQAVAALAASAAAHEARFRSAEWTWRR